MSEIEGVGELVTGAALAAAIEPSAGSTAIRRDGDCLNCSTPLTGAYCSACGQKARVPRSLRTFFGDLVAGLFNFEGKIWRTLPMLAWRPGEMTRRYVEGERARFVSPVALYLFTVFAMFAVLNFTGSMGGMMDDGLDKASTAERTELTRLETERQRGVERQADVAAIDVRIAAKKRDIAELEKVKSGQIVNIDGQEDQDAPQWLKVAAAKIQANPEAFIAKVQDAASKYSWLLIPLSVPFVWLLFPFSRHYHLYDHTVFVTYSLAFMMMLVIAAGLLVSTGLTSVASLLFFIPPIHMYRQLRGAYLLGRISAFVRTLMLVTFSCIVATLFMVVVFAIGAL
ncbi:MAG: DUF3667 domain-containing protein [Pseudomonadota bacterium]